jgi:hypothetical protein
MLPSFFQRRSRRLTARASGTILYGMIEMSASSASFAAHRRAAELSSEGTH